MTCYEVFGGVLQSDIEFPELPASERERPDWTLRRRESLVPLSDAVVVGVEDLVGGIAARLERGRDGFRLRFDDTGSFDIARDGARIDWSPLPGAPPAVVRADVLGRVLSVALHAAGDLCLHASAAAIGGKAVALVGPRGYGKSTLTMALVANGARLVADDTVRLSGAPPRAAVAVPSLRLREDAAARFGVGWEPEVGDKVIVQDAPVALERWLPLDAIYVLVPRAADGAAALVRRQRLAPLAATLALVRHGKIAPLLGGEEAASVLPRASAVANAVPVFALEVARDLSRIGDAARTLAGWHGGA
jgi:hypothetical protein